jgi:Ser/Thr protein kinase RdoA (MazF antagonist)
MGQRLAAVHRVEAVGAFGYLEPARRDLTGECPPADPDAVRVGDPEPDWRAAMRAYADRELDALAASPLADLHGPVGDTLDERIDALAGPFEPALAHVDGLLENVRIDPGGALLGMLDWGFTVAATPAYDLVHVAGGLVGGVWTVADPPPWADRAREALIEGYAERAPERVERYRRNRSCYELLRLARMAAHFEEWLGLTGLDDPERVAATGRALWARIEGVIES